jgi:hypothetical protein
MMKESGRSLFLPLFVAFLGFSAFLRTTGSENVRAVQIVALLAAGMGLGVALASLKTWIRLRAEQKEGQSQ